MEVIVKKIGTMSNGNMYILLNSTVDNVFGKQIMSAFVSVVSTDLVEGSTITLTPIEYKSIQWTA